MSMGQKQRMDSRDAHHNDADNRDVAEPKLRGRKNYTRPQLRELGDMRGITLGGSPGIGESGAATIFKT